jgi:hypothetical protein
VAKSRSVADRGAWRNTEQQDHDRSHERTSADAGHAHDETGEET